MLSIYRSVVVLAVLALVALAGVAFLGSGTASAAPGEPKSCMAFEVSEISPPGSNPEFPDGAPGLKEEIAELGIEPYGAFVSFFAQLHEGSHEDCDAAVE